MLETVRINSINNLLCILVLSLFGGLMCGCTEKDPPLPNPSSGTQVSQNNGNVGDSNGSTAKGHSENTPRTPESVLAGMVEAYKNAKYYADRGRILIEYETLERTIETTEIPMVFALERPNLVRMELGEGILVSNGSNIYASANLQAVFGQILEIPVEKNKSIDICSIFPDYILFQAMELPIMPELMVVPPQVLLLLAENPLKTLSPEGTKVELLEPKQIGGYLCDRVWLSSALGNRTLWIDRETKLLMRMEFPIEGYNLAEGVREVKSLRAEFGIPRINPKIDRSETFTMEEPDFAVHVQQFIPPDVGLLGTLPAAADEAALTGPSGEPLSLASLKRKTHILTFWMIDSEPCEGAIKEFARLQREFQADERFRFIAVNMDSSEVSDATIKKTYELWNVNFPVFRAHSDLLMDALRIDAVPTLVMLDPDGVIQYYYKGTMTASSLSIMLKKYLAGELPSENIRTGFDQDRKVFRAMMERYAARDFYALSADDSRAREVAIAEARLPQRLKLKKLWSNAELNAPGNILVVPENGKPDKILIAYEGNRFALLNSLGKVENTFNPGIKEDNSRFSFARTGLDADGKRYYALGASFGRTLHVLDESFKPILSYPPPGQKDAEIADVRIIEKGPSGELVLVLTLSRENNGGVRMINLEGETIWDNETITCPVQLGIAKNSKGESTILVSDLNDVTGSIHELDINGVQIGKIRSFDGNIIAWFGSDDMNYDGNTEICSIIPELLDDTLSVICLEREGTHRWRYGIPYGTFQHPVELIASGDLCDGPEKEWIIISADGTIHILGYDGKPIDTFAPGELVSGLGTVRWNEKRVLLVASPNELTAWEIE